MNLNKSLMALLLVALVSGCNEGVESLSVSENPVVITATSGEHVAAVDSRTSVGDVASDGSLVMQWIPDDKIGVFGARTVNARFVSTHTEAANSADFTGKLQSDDIPQAAYYPYSETATDRTSIAVEIPSVQEYADVQSPSRYDFKAATVEKVTGGYTMSFKQMATLLRLNISLKDTDGLLADETLTSVSMTVADRALTGRYTYNLDNLNSGLQAVETAGSLTVKMTNPPATTETLVAYAVVAPGLYKDCTADFVLTTDRHTVRFSTKLLTDFEAGVFYDLPLTAEVLRNNNAEVETLPDVEEPEETANCYMITTAGEHSFLATQIGNGDKGIIPDMGFHVTSAAISPKSAGLIWQDTENFVSGVNLKDDRVYYTTNTNVGNAVIAVYSGENGTGDILWSWHIWGVGDELPSDEEYTNKAGAKFTVMDRTLGAHSSTSYYATLYQWGRKDPIPNSTIYYVDGAATDIEKSYPVFKDNNATILTGIQHPGELVNASEDWLGTANEYLWGDYNKDDQYTWYSTGKYSNPAAGAGWSHQKTIYDPSPVGYRVANKFTFTGFAVNTTGDTPSGNSTTKLDYINYVKYDNGWWFKKDADDTVGTYFPMTGSRSGSTGSLWVDGNAPYNTVNYTASYWSSAAQKNAKQSHQFSMNPYSTKNSAAGSNSLNAINTVDFAYRVNAFAVRCVREN